MKQFYNKIQALFTAKAIFVTITWKLDIKCVPCLQATLISKL